MHPCLQEVNAVTLSYKRVKIGNISFVVVKWQVFDSEFAGIFFYKIELNHVCFPVIFYSDLKKHQLFQDYTTRFPHGEYQKGSNDLEPRNF